MSPTGSALTAYATVNTAGRADLEKLLDEVGDDTLAHPDFPFKNLKLVHFMRWVLLDVEGKVRLVLESNHDGTRDEHLAELAREMGKGLRTIYAHCEGSPCGGGGTCTDGELVCYLKSTAVSFAAFHKASHGRSVERIRLEARIRNGIQSLLDAMPAAERKAKRASEVRAAILRGLPPADLEALRTNEPVVPKAGNLYEIVLGGVVALGAVFPAAVVYATWLLITEQRDAVETRRPDAVAIAKLYEREDLQTQNQLTHFVEIKPGRLRLLTLKVVLAAINLLAGKVFNQGALGDMSTIHFARWAIVENGRYLVFFSNYDGSWESYLGDFVDKARYGLTAVWSNTDRFPRSCLLAFAGAKDEERFKVWTRLRQVHTQVWFPAYPDLSVKNIQQNARIAAGLQGEQASEHDAAQWLALL